MSLDHAVEIIEVVGEESCKVKFKTIEDFIQYKNSQEVLPRLEATQTLTSDELDFLMESFNFKEFLGIDEEESLNQFLSTEDENNSIILGLTQEELDAIVLVFSHLDLSNSSVSSILQKTLGFETENGVDSNRFVTSLAGHSKTTPVSSIDIDFKILD